ncbi:hypothetical protein CPB83DRAFT_935475 [Crepidotus variabilis]|uniref:Uncharacterized protein n=1 Tax=Crepidotus variabilis TaxID=179855 RepID=A0A9P6ER72_9AGAR|nr:hypothetical protein CPB83DRAFT_935475 [Crepidotus variabilis]
MFDISPPILNKVIMTISNKWHKPKSSAALIIVFDTLNSLVLLCLSATLFTAWSSPRICCVSTWFLYIFSCALSSLSYLLIVKWQSDHKPIHSVCLFQAAALYATPAFVSVSAVAFLAQVFLDINYALGTGTLSKGTIQKFGVWKPGTFVRDDSGMICSFADPQPGLVSSIINFASALTMLGLGLLNVITLRRDCKQWHAIWQANSKRSFDFLLRTSLFVTSPLLTMTIVFLDLLPPKGSINQGTINILLAAGGSFRTSSEYGCFGVHKNLQNDRTNPRLNVRYRLSVPSRRPLGMLEDMGPYSAGTGSIRQLYSAYLFNNVYYISPFYAFVQTEKDVIVNARSHHDVVAVLYPKDLISALCVFFLDPTVS